MLSLCSARIRTFFITSLSLSLPHFQLAASDKTWIITNKCQQIIALPMVITENSISSSLTGFLTMSISGSSLSLPRLEAANSSSLTFRPSTNHVLPTSSSTNHSRLFLSSTNQEGEIFITVQSTTLASLSCPI